MKTATGIVRHLDDLGRVVIPKELRQAYSLEMGSPLEIFTDGEEIILRPYRPGCQACGSLKNLREFQGIRICEPCLDGFDEAVAFDG